MTLQDSLMKIYMYLEQTNLGFTLFDMYLPVFTEEENTDNTRLLHWLGLSVGSV